MEWDVGLSSIHKTLREAGITSHGSMNGALSQEGTVDIVGGITWYSTDHIRRICQFQKLIIINLFTSYPEALIK